MQISNIKLAHRIDLRKLACRCKEQPPKFSRLQLWRIPPRVSWIGYKSREKTQIFNAHGRDGHGPKKHGTLPVLYVIIKNSTSVYIR